MSGGHLEDALGRLLDHLVTAGVLSGIGVASLGHAHPEVAAALERARSFESLEDTFVSTVEALANALEANDEYTSSHTRWITDMALKVGGELGFDANALNAAIASYQQRERRFGRTSDQVRSAQG